ncbi:MAG TPA: hypothetical protein VNE19_07170 [Methylomirabilota bacterium]|nr:hypothetical protein [Methylomirabilota bacterium]
MSATSGVIVDLDGEVEAAPGRDRRRALTLAFALCLAIGSTGLGRDGPAATQPTVPLTTMVYNRDGTFLVAASADHWGPLEHLSLPVNSPGVLLSWIPDRLANEALPPLPFFPVRVRAVPGLAIEGVRDGDYRMVTWTESGNVYWLVSDHGDIADLIRLADSLR